MKALLLITLASAVALASCGGPATPNERSLRTNLDEMLAEMADSRKERPVVERPSLSNRQRYIAHYTRGDNLVIVSRPATGGDAAVLIGAATRRGYVTIRLNQGRCERVEGGSCDWLQPDEWRMVYDRTTRLAENNGFPRA